MRRPAGLPPRAEPRATLTDRASVQRILDDGEVEECECFRRRGHSRTRPPRSQALDRPQFFYRNQPVNRRFTPRYQQCQDFILRPSPGNTSLPAVDTTTPQSWK